MIMTLRHLKLWKRRSSVGNGAGSVSTACDQSAVGPAPGVAHGAVGDSMFRSLSSDSGYSDVPTASQKHKRAVFGPALSAEDSAPVLSMAPHAASALPSYSDSAAEPVVGPFGVTRPLAIIPDGATVGRPAPPPPIALQPNVIVLIGGSSVAGKRVEDGFAAADASRPRVGFGQSRCRMRQTMSSHGFVLSQKQATSASGGFLADDASSPTTTRTQTMVSVEAFFEFVRRRDAESIRYALRDAHYDIDLQDVVSVLFFYRMSTVSVVYHGATK